MAIINKLGSGSTRPIHSRNKHLSKKMSTQRSNRRIGVNPVRRLRRRILRTVAEVGGLSLRTYNSKRVKMKRKNKRKSLRSVSSKSVSDIVAVITTEIHKCVEERPNYKNFTRLDLIDGVFTMYSKLYVKLKKGDHDKDWTGPHLKKLTGIVAVIITLLKEIIKLGVIRTMVKDMKDVLKYHVEMCCEVSALSSVPVDLNVGCISTDIIDLTVDDSIEIPEISVGDLNL